MYRLLLPLLLLLIAVPASVRAQRLASTPQACEAPPGLARPDAPLPHLQAALAAGGPVAVLAVGSGTTVGEVNGTPGASFPYRMVDALETARSGTTFDLTVRGGRNMTAEAMLALLKDALAKQAYPLVLWQTGTVEAVRALPPEAMRDVLQQGIAAVQAAGGDVILVDSQFSRFLRANAELEPYEAVMQAATGQPGVVLFHRFELMRAWASDGSLDLERVRKPDREKAVALLNTCLGDALARFVLDGAARPAR